MATRSGPPRANGVADRRPARVVWMRPGEPDATRALTQTLANPLSLILAAAQHLLSPTKTRALRRSAHAAATDAQRPSASSSTCTRWAQVPRVVVERCEEQPGAAAASRADGYRDNVFFLVDVG